MSCISEGGDLSQIQPHFVGVYIFFRQYYLVGALGHEFYDFPYVGNNNPNWLIFFIGVETTNQLFIYLFKPGWFLNWRATLWQSALKVHPWLCRLSRIMRVRPGSDSADEHSKTPWQLQFQRVDNETRNCSTGFCWRFQGFVYPHSQLPSILGVFACIRCPSSERPNLVLSHYPVTKHC